MDHQHRAKITREHEIWGLTFWVERIHGDNGWFHIAQQMDRLVEACDWEGVSIWREVGQRWEELQATPENPN